MTYQPKSPLFFLFDLETVWNIIQNSDKLLDLKTQVDRFIQELENQK